MCVCLSCVIVISLNFANFFNLSRSISMRLCICDLRFNRNIVKFAIIQVKERKKKKPRRISINCYCQNLCVELHLTVCMSHFDALIFFLLFVLF